MTALALLAALAGGALAIATAAYLALALAMVLRFRTRRPAKDGPWPAVSVMVPVHGAPPGLEECLRSVFVQDCPEMQIVLGLHSADDPGRAVIERLIAEHPAVEATIVVDERRVGANPKICNLANMYIAVRHDLIVVLDSDVMVEPDFARLMAEALREPGVGAATCPYRALPAPGLASALGATYIDDWLLPSALVDSSWRGSEVCYGAAVAMTRAAHEASGGFEARASAVAEDDVLAELVTAAGYRIAVVPRIVATVVAEPGIGSLWHHELRWLRTVRACRPRDHALAIVTYTVPSVALLLGSGPAIPALALVAAVLGLRVALHFAVRARLSHPSAPGVAMVPLRECFGFAVWVASFMSREMRWGERVLHGTRGRRMEAGAGERR